MGKRNMGIRVELTQFTKCAVFCCLLGRLFLESDATHFNNSKILLSQDF